MLKIQNLVKKYGQKTVLNDFDLKIDTGEMVAIMGASGSGKSTLLNILGLIENFDAGTYVFDAETNVKPNSRLANKLIREKIGYIFQSFALIENQTVTQNLAIAQKYLRSSKAEKGTQIKQVLATVGLTGYQSHKIYELSGGQQQRVAVARCLIKPSTLILADEPTGSLDETNRDLVLNEIKTINQSGKTVVIVTHDPAVAAFCDRTIELPMHVEV